MKWSDVLVFLELWGTPCSLVGPFRKHRKTETLQVKTGYLTDRASPLLPSPPRLLSLFSVFVWATRLRHTVRTILLKKATPL
jgi:hypothetical protein